MADKTEREKIDEAADALRLILEQGRAEGYVEGVAKEREACARLVENWGAEDDEPTDADVALNCIAAAIRARRALGDGR